MSMSSQPLLFADLLRRYRLAAGLTQNELAEAAGLGLRGVSDLERGVRSSPRLETVQRLANALGLNESERAAFLAAARRPRHRQRPHAVHPAAPATVLHIPAPLAPGPVAWLPPLVGRVRELEQIERLLSGPAQDQRPGPGQGLGAVAAMMPPVLLLAGEPGIGKTRLLQEAAVRAAERGWCVLAGGCTRRSGQEAYAPLVGALARFLSGRTPAQQRHDLVGCAWLVRLVPELAERAVVPAPSWALAPEQEQRVLFAAVARFLANIAGSAGTLLLLDDLQWAGADALDLLATLARASAHGERPLRVIGAYRSTEVPAGTALADLLADLGREGLAALLALAALSAQQAAALLAELMQAQGSAWSDERCQRVVQRTGGVPYFLLSCAQAQPAGPSESDESGESDDQGGTGGQMDEHDSGEADDALPIPWNVAESIRQRVAYLPERAQQVLRLAAVAGREVDYGLLLDAAGHWSWPKAELLLSLEAASQARLLVELKGTAARGGSADGAHADGGLGYGFAHDLVREVVLADLSGARRADLHLQVAQALEGLSEPARERRAAELAWHFVEAGVQGRALPHALRAGDTAEAVFAHGQAEQHYRSALEIAGALGDRPREAETLEKLGTVLHTRARYDEALQVLEQAAQLYETLGEREARALVVARIGWTHAERGTHAEGIARVREELSSASARTPPCTPPLTPRCRAVLALALAQLYASVRASVESLAACAQAMELAHGAGDEQMLLRAMAVRARHLAYTRAPEGLAALEEVEARAEAAGDLWSLLRALNGLAELHQNLGQIESAGQYYERAFSVAERLGDPAEMAYALGLRGLPAFFRGDWREARTYYEQAEALVRQVPVTRRTSYPLLWLGLLDLIDGKEESGTRHLREALTMGQLCGDLQMQRYAQYALAEADLVQGRPDAAQARLEPLLGHPGEQGEDISFMLPLVAGAYLEQGNVPRAEAILAQSLSQEPPIFRLDLLRVQALLCLRQGRGGAATAALEEALRLCRGIPYPYAEAKALYVYGQVCEAQGEPERAREKYEAALSICDRLGEGLYRPHIERALAALENA